MTTVARSAIIGYLNSYEEEELGKADRIKEKAEIRHERRPSGLGVSFDQSKPPTESPNKISDLTTIVEHVKKADTPEEKERRLATVTETLRTLCETKETEALKVKTETHDESIGHYLKSLLP